MLLVTRIKHYFEENNEATIFVELDTRPKVS